MTNLPAVDYSPIIETGDTDMTNSADLLPIVDFAEQPKPVAKRKPRKIKLDWSKAEKSSQR